MSDIVQFGGDKPKKTSSARKNRREDDTAAENALPFDEQLATPTEKARADGETGTQRSLAAVVLRRRGFSYETIAKDLDYASPRAARQSVIATIAASGSIEDNKTLRELESSRLDHLLASVWSKAVNPKDADQLQFNRRASEIIEQHSKLHGLNAPSVLAVINPDADRFAAVITELRRAQTGDVDAEGDVLAFMEDEDGTFSEETGDEGGA